MLTHRSSLQSSLSTRRDLLLHAEPVQILWRPLDPEQGSEIADQIESRIWFEPRAVSADQRQLFEEVKKKFAGDNNDNTDADDNGGHSDYGAKADAVAAAMEEIANSISETEAGDPLPSDMLALLWALEQYAHADGTYAKAAASDKVKGSVSKFQKDTDKCNKFVTDAYAGDQGAKLGLEVEGGGFPAKHDDATGRNEARIANEFASGVHFPYLTDAKPYDAKNPPHVGDILAYHSKDNRKSGHVTLYLGNGLVISAKKAGIRIESADYESNRSNHTGVGLTRRTR